MSPFSMRCTTCGDYIYKGRKFNARKETPTDERYLNSIQIYRFYLRCPRCSAEIVFRTDPRNQDYVCEKGAHRNTDPWKRGLGADPEREETDEQRLDRLERLMADEEDAGERNAMAELEAKTEDAKREMAVADALDEIRSRNARLEKAQRDGEGPIEVTPSVDEEKARQEKEDEEAARKAFAFARAHAELEEPMDEDDEEGWTTESSTAAAGPSSSNGDSDAALPPATAQPTGPTTEMPPPPTFKRQVKKKKDLSAALGIKKKKPLV
jgi:hypothetical protein